MNVDRYNGNLKILNGCKILIEHGRKIGSIDGIFKLSNHSKSNNETKDLNNLILSNLDFASRDVINLR